MELRYRQAPPRAVEWRALIPLLAAFAWLTGGEGWRWWLFALLPMAWLTTAGIALLAKIHDGRVHQIHAAGSLSGLLLALPALLLGGGSDALIAGALCLWSFVVAGRISIDYQPLYEGALAPEKRAGVDAKAALDESLMAYFVAVGQIPSGASAEALCRDAERIETVLEDQGWLRNPASFHLAPQAPEAVLSDAARWRGLDFERVSYPSAFLAHPQLPLAAQYGSYVANQRAHLKVFRHVGADRPWLMCIHGYRMGADWMDFGLFNPLWAHQKLGFNLIMPLLPLHGQRRNGSKSGDGYFDGNVLELLHAQTQALWDLRRALAWLRDREPKARVGVYGVSLGGFNAALLAGYEPDLDFVVSGIPLVDAAAALWRNIPAVHERYYRQFGMTLARYQRILSPISPLSAKPLIARERLHIFAGAADRVVTPDHPLKLAQHWQVPVSWYQGAHLTVRSERATRETLDRALRGAGWK